MKSVLNKTKLQYSFRRHKYEVKSRYLSLENKSKCKLYKKKCFDDVDEESDGH